MTQRQWLERERQPDHSGINARQTLKRLARKRGREIDRKVMLNNVRASVRKLIQAMAA